MASTPAAAPGGLASLPQAPSSSLPGFHEAPPTLRISRPSWIVRTEFHRKGTVEGKRGMG
uniref:Uncharacterized protein n=1 Tax=Leersia perrieri TaxID=77586 RepID=A0A0D9W8S0_9ORYZ